MSLPTEMVELQNNQASSDFFPDVSEVLAASGCQQAFVHIPFHQHHHQWDTNGMVRFMIFNHSESANPPTPSSQRAAFHSKPFLSSGGFYYGELQPGLNSEMFCVLGLGTELEPLAHGSFRQVYRPIPIPASASSSGTHVQNRISEPAVLSPPVQGCMSRTGRQSAAPVDAWQTMHLGKQPVVAAQKEWDLKPEDVVVKLSVGFGFRKLQVKDLPGRYNDLFHVPTGSVNEFMMITRSTSLSALAARGTLPMMYSLSISVGMKLPAVIQMVAGYFDASSGLQIQGRQLRLHAVPPGVYTIEGFLVVWLQLVVYSSCHPQFEFLPFSLHL